MSSDEPKNSAGEAPSGAASAPQPIEEQPTVQLTAADLRHTEPAATSVPPVMLPPVAPPSGVAPKSQVNTAATGTDETLRLPVPGAPAGRKPSPQPSSPSQAGPVAPQPPVSPAAPVVPVSPGAPTVPISPGAPNPQFRAATTAPQASPAAPAAPVSPAASSAATQAPVSPAAPSVPVSPAPQGKPVPPRAPGRPKPSPTPQAAPAPEKPQVVASAPTEARKVVAPSAPVEGRAVPAAAKPSKGDAGEPAAAGDESGVPTDGVDPEGAAPALRRMSGTTVMIALLLLLFGFTLVVQLKANDGDTTLLTMRQDDLVRILSDLESQEQRTQAEVAELEDRKESLSSGAEGREAALREASERADDLGVLAGELPARGTGLVIKINGGDDQVEADDLLNAVQELRGAGAEAMQIEGGDGTAVRIVASTSFQDSPAGAGGDRFGVIVDGKRLTSTYTITVIGDPKTMETALRIPGGVIESIMDNGGNVTPQEQGVVDVSAIHDVTTLRYARPVS